MELKTIKIKFVDYWNTFVPEEDIVVGLLRERYNVEFSDNPDYLFFGPFSDENLKYENCVRIFWTGENICPDFNMCDYAVGYDTLDFGDRYCRFPGYYKVNWDGKGNTKSHVDLAAHKHEHCDSALLKRAFCSFVYSHGNGAPIRDNLFEQLSQYKKVDSGGRYKNNILNEPNGVADKLAFEGNHKFSIACENSSHRGYVTEKIIDAFAAHTVPIYWGADDVEMYFNKNGFINCNGKSIDDIVSEVKRVDNDDELYMRMLSEPAFASDIYLQEKEVGNLRNFLYDIFDQELTNAYRRNREYWGKLYFEKRVVSTRISTRVNRIKDWIKKIISFIFRGLRIKNRE